MAEHGERKDQEPLLKGPWDVVVDVYLKKDCPEPKFEIKSTLPKSGPKDDLVFNNDRRPGFMIRFNFFDETNSGYRFPPQPKVREACWSKIGTVCAKTEAWEVFEPRHILDGGAALVVYNDNPPKHPPTDPPEGLGPFQYTLRVTKDGGDTYCDLDPGGVDQNGQRQ